MAKRRAANKGSIHQRKDGRWVASLNLGYSGGKRKRKHFFGKTQAEVRAKLIKARHELQQGLPLPDERQTVKQFLERWLEDSARPRVRPRTYACYESNVRVHIIPELGRIPLAKLTPQQIQSFLNQKDKTDLSARSVQLIHGVLRAALAQAYKWQLLAFNPAKLVDSPRVVRLEVTPFTPEEAKRFLEAAKGDRLEALYSVAVALGLRQGEALGLRWEDLDFEAGTLRVKYQMQRIDSKLQLVEPKTARSRRTIALPRSIVVALKAHKKRQLEERVFAGSAWQEQGLVFTTTIGTPLEGSNFTKRSFKQILKKAGLPDMRFHDLRHTAASLLLVQGVQPRVVMETLGHSQIGLTMNTYSHVMPVLQRDAADKMDGFLRELT